jgi:hypothetical protein
MQSSRNRAVERYLHLEPGVFAISLRSRALDQSILAHGIAIGNFNNFLLRPSCCRLQVSGYRD